jgi:CspA family cold shock protein
MSKGTVKFFNPAKGFGFIAPEDGGADIFVHISAVERSGLNSLNDGDEVSYELESDRRSGKMAAINLVLEHAAPAGARPPRAPRPGGPGGGFDRGGPPRRSSYDDGGRASAGSGAGVVKWFNAQKGFGFIQPSDGGADVFVHVSAVERAGLNSLSEGQQVAYDLQADRRTGKLAATNLRLE